MANDGPSRIYISAMEADVVGWPHFGLQAADLLAGLSAIGYVVKRQNGWTLLIP